MAGRSDRRRFLGTAAAGALASGAAMGLEERILLAAVQDGKADRPATLADPASMPYGQVGDVRVSRLMIGGNLIGGWAHSRDLMYVSRLFKAYNTDEKVFETLALAEQHGINTIQNDPACMDLVYRYNKERGGKMQSLVCIHPEPDKDKVRNEIAHLIDRGATLLYTHGEMTDRLTMAGRVDVLAQCMELIREAGVPAGIGSHSLETPKACEKENVGAQFYVKTFHTDQYWSASPEDKRQEWCWYLPRSGEAGTYFDNMWCINPTETSEFFKSVNKPWFAFKVLAAGALHPRVAFPYVLRNGADFVIVGMFDFQIAENVAMFKETFGKLGNRERPWMA